MLVCKQNKATINIVISVIAISIQLLLAATYS